MDLNQTVLTGKVLGVTTTGNSNGTKMKLGTIGVYCGKNKDTGKPEFDNIPFVSYGASTEYIQEDTKMVLSGRLNTYQKDTGGQYKTTVVQLMVLHAETISQPELNANTHLDRDISNALNTLDFDKLTNQLNEASN